MELNYTVALSEEGTSVKEFLYKKGISVTLLKKAKMGGITVTGKQVTVRYLLTAGDEVTVRVADTPSEKIEPIAVPVNIVYEDDDLLVADKPTNMPTHPSRGNSLPTLANAIIAIKGRSFVFRAVNRLDRDTSGLVLIAKNAHAASRLSTSMKNGEFTKKYLAIVEGCPQESHGFIDAPIRRECDGGIKRVVAPDGKRALTEYTVLENRGDTALLELRLHTGRTHQIRVHTAHIGHPLVGDFLYGTRSESGYFLRCHKLSFPHPTAGETVNIEI